MADVAARAGVSPTTVSFVLSRKPGTQIPEATRDRVLRAATALRYHPNATARALRTSRTLTIGFISDRIASGSYATGAIQGAQDVAWRHDHLLLVINTGGNAAVERRAAASLLERQVDGVVYASYSTREVNPVLDLHSVPTVLVNCFTHAPRFKTILPDEFNAARASTMALLQRGHRDIVFINGPGDYWAASQRQAGFDAALQDYGEASSRARRYTGDWWPESAFAITKTLLRTGVPTAILCGNDRMAMGCYDALRERGIRIPDDVSVLSFDDQEFAAHLRPPLGSVRLPAYEMAVRAVELLVDPAVDSIGNDTEYLSCEQVLRKSLSSAEGRSARGV